MKRDMELIRLLLIQQEIGTPPELAAYPVEEQLYNLQLMADANLIIARFDTGNNGEVIFASTKRLTWAGHDFLDSTRDSKIWNKAKEQVLKSGASWTFDILKEWVKYELKQKLGLPNQ